MRRGTRIALWLSGLVAAGAISFVMYLAAEFSQPMASEYANRLPFDSATWKSHPRETTQDWPMRLRMVDHLLSKYALTGMSREAVIDLLGPPDDTPYFEAPGRMIYYLGPERGMFRIDSEWLVIETRDSRVVNAEIRTD